MDIGHKKTRGADPSGRVLLKCQLLLETYKLICFLARCKFAWNAEFVVLAKSASTNDSTESYDCKDVRDDHDHVEEVSQRPNKVALNEGADEHADASKDAERNDCFFTEEVLHVDFAEHVPSDDC